MTEPTQDIFYEKLKQDAIKLLSTPNGLVKKFSLDAFGASIWESLTIKVNGCEIEFTIKTPKKDGNQNVLPNNESYQNY